MSVEDETPTYENLLEQFAEGESSEDEESQGDELGPAIGEEFLNSEGEPLLTFEQPISQPTSPRPPSRIPLAEGATLQGNEEQQRQVKWFNPQVSRAQANALTAQEIARGNADEARKKMRDVNSATAKRTQRQAEKEFKVLDAGEHHHQQKCDLMNGYKKLYEGKINFPFKAKGYTRTTPLASIEADIRSVQVILNTKDVPAILNALLIKSSEIAEMGASLLGHPYINLNHFADNMGTAVESGFFNEEVQQLAIELAYLLQAPARVRLAGKWGYLAYDTGMSNFKNATSSSPQTSQQQHPSYRPDPGL